LVSKIGCPKRPNFFLLRITDNSLTISWLQSRSTKPGEMPLAARITAKRPGANFVQRTRVCSIRRAYGLVRLQ
jgi:hypothetical protein